MDIILLLIAVLYELLAMMMSSILWWLESTGLWNKDFFFQIERDGTLGFARLTNIDTGLHEELTIKWKRKEL